MHLGLYGPTSTLSMGHATGLATIGYAADLVRSGRARRVVATVTDALTPAVAAAYHASGLAGPGGAGGPGRFALTEGSVALVLESRDAAAERGARPWATSSAGGWPGTGVPAGGGTATARASSGRSAPRCAALSFVPATWATSGARRLGTVSPTAARTLR